jgi:hypothetical protein
MTLEHGGDVMKKALAVLALAPVFYSFFWLMPLNLRTNASYSDNPPPGPNFTVQVAVLSPSEAGGASLSPVLLDGVNSWPKASVHEIVDRNNVCAAHFQDEPTILYRPSLKAHITGFRMTHVLGRRWNVGLAPGLEPLTPEIERDCPGSYDLLVLPDVLHRAVFN